MNKLTVIVSALALTFVAVALLLALKGNTSQPAPGVSASDVERQPARTPIAESELARADPIVMDSSAAVDWSRTNDMPMRSADYYSGEAFEDEVDSSIDEPIDVSAVIDVLADPNPATRAEAEALLGAWQSEEWADTFETLPLTEEDDIGL